MNRKKNTTTRKMKSEKGQPVFGDNVDEVLAKKIIDHSAKSAREGRAQTHASSKHHATHKATGSGTPTFTYHTPEEKHVTKTAGYGIAALVCLFLLGILTFLWSKFRED